MATIKATAAKTASLGQRAVAGLDALLLDGYLCLKAFFGSRDVQKTLLVVGLVTVGSALQANSDTIELTELQTAAQGWIYFGLRAFGGLLSAGGMTVAIMGFVGRDEGFDKVFKIGSGLLMLGLGIWMISNPNTIYTTLNLNKVFSMKTT
jgi:hypothetical protein